MDVERNESIEPQPTVIAQPTVVAADPAVEQVAATTAPVVQPVTPVGEVVQPAPVVAAPHDVATRQVFTTTRFAPAAVVTGIVAIALLVFGLVMMVRAGFEGDIDEPVVEVAGYTGTALLGMIVAFFGLIMLGAALSRDRGAILFTSILLGVLALTAAIEPTIGGGSLAVERGFAVLLTIAAGFVALLAVVVPNVRRTRTSSSVSDHA